MRSQVGLAARDRPGRPWGSWLRWEFGRRIEVTPVIRLITLERFLKATVLVAGSVALLFLDRHSGAHQVILNIQSEYNLDAGRGLWHRLVGSVLDRAAGVPNGHLLALAVAGLLYGGLEALEGFGLLLRRRWAEYLVLVATVAFIPVEIEELATRPSVFKAVALLANLLIVGYLIWRKRLFLERPSERRSVHGTDAA
ncbi:MAG: DUF2127 domain-containing protein [Candidatus Dormibacteraeota bacterium]|nr:DUF2127 domain-containing protein [Candidatus Dormibacteraeota bacterium]